MSMASNALGYTYNNLSLLCSSSLINKWSLYKPVSSATNSASMTSSTIHDSSNANFMMMKNSNFGLNPNLSQLQYIADWFLAGNQSMSTQTFPTLASWSYTQPSGGASSPYRLGDFRAYNPAATPFLLYPSDISFVKESGVQSMTFLPAMKYGLNSYEQISNGSLTCDSAEIPLNQLNMGGADLLNGEWSFALLFILKQSNGYYNYILCGSYVNSSTTNYINPISSSMNDTVAVNFDGYFDNTNSPTSRKNLVDKLNALTPSTSSNETADGYYIDAIPVLVKNLAYNTGNDTYYLSGSSPKIIAYPQINTLYGGKVRIRCTSKFASLTITPFYSTLFMIYNSQTSTLIAEGHSVSSGNGYNSNPLVVHRPQNSGMQLTHTISIINSGSSSITLNKSGLQIYADGYRTSLGACQVFNYTYNSRSIGSEITDTTIVIPANSTVYLTLKYNESAGSPAGSISQGINSRPTWVVNTYTATGYYMNTSYTENNITKDFTSMGGLIGVVN